MITTVTYERLYNLGNFENMRLAATAIVEGDNVPAAFAEAKRAVEDQHAAYLAEKAEAERRRQEEWEARRQAQMDRADRTMLRQASDLEDERSEDDPIF